MTPTTLTLAATSPLKVLQLTDCHLMERQGQTLMGVDTELSLRKTLEYLRGHHDWPPDLILLTGDLVQDPFLSSYQRLLSLLEPLEVPWVCLAGNHDDPDMMKQILCAEGPHCARRIISTHWQILCLNSHRPHSHQGHLAEKELAFLQDTLMGDRERHALIALHHPPLSIGSTWMDAMQVDNGNEFLELVGGFHQVAGIVFGHIHQVFCSHHASIKLWSAPSTCFQFKPGSDDFALDDRPPGWRWLELHPNGHIDTRVERIANPPCGLDFSSPGY